MLKQKGGGGGREKKRGGERKETKRRESTRARRVGQGETDICAIELYHRLPRKPLERARVHPIS